MTQARAASWARIVWPRSAMVRLRLSSLSCARAKGAARLELDGANGRDTKFRKLRPELYLFGNLLEQSPPPFAHRYATRRPHPLGQLLPHVLVVANPCRDSL